MVEGGIQKDDGLLLVSFIACSIKDRSLALPDGSLMIVRKIELLLGIGFREENDYETYNQWSVLRSV